MAPSSTAADGCRSSSKAEVVLRGMLLEQKRECATLHANALFFWQKSKQPQAGPPPVIDDLEAEGQARLSEVITKAAEARGTARAGVWSGVGPYTNLGEMQQVERSAAAHMPHLNRDDLAAAQNGPRHHQQQQRRARMSGTGSTGHGVTTVTAAAMTGAVAAAAAAAVAAAAAAAATDTPAGGKGGTCQAAKLLHHKTLAQFSTAERLEASFPAAAVRQAERRQRAAKARPHTYFNESRAVADLADAAGSYGSSSSLATKKKQLPGVELVKRRAAAAAVADAEADAAHARTAADAMLPSTQRSAHCRSVAASSAGDSKHAFFITLQATTAAAAAGSPTVTPRSGRLQLGGASVPVSDAGAGHSSGQAARGAHPRMSMSLLPEDAAVHSLRSSTCQDGRMHEELSTTMLQQQQQQRCLAEQLAQPRPAFTPLTALTAQPREIGDAHAGTNPVTALHNDFVGVRHAGFTALQESLWERSQTRAKARADPAASAAFNRSLLAHLVQQGGRLAPGWLPGATPESPFARAAKQQEAQAAAVTATGEAAAAAAAPGLRPIKPAELELLQQFYAALCGLVERIRLSDPLSLTLVHQVKLLLEAGTLLQPALVQQAVGCVADFTSSCGLRRYNAFALPLLAFICKCTGTSQADFDSWVAAAGIQVVLHPQAKAAAGEGRALLDVSMPPGCGSPRATAGGAPAPAGHSQGRRSSGGHPGGSQQQEQQPQCSGTPRTAAPARTSNSGQQTTAAAAAAMSPRRAASQAATQPLAAVGGSHCGGKRGSSSSGASTSRASGSGDNTSSGGTVVAASLPGITLAAAAAAAELAAAVHSSPASQRALADAAAEIGSLQVRVRGVAGLVDVWSAAAADDDAGCMATHLDAAEAAAAASLAADSEAAADNDADAALPDLGADEDGLPLSWRQRQQEGLQSWSQAALEAQHPQQD